MWNLIVVQHTLTTGRFRPCCVRSDSTVLVSVRVLSWPSLSILVSFLMTVDLLAVLSAACGYADDTEYGTGSLIQCLFHVRYFQKVGGVRMRSAVQSVWMRRQDHSRGQSQFRDDRTGLDRFSLSTEIWMGPYPRPFSRRVKVKPW